MPENILSELSACLWDLRAQCEQKLRALSHAERHAQEYRDRTGERPVLKARLVADVETVISCGESIREAARECLALVQRLPPELPPLRNTGTVT